VAAAGAATPTPHSRGLLVPCRDSYHTSTPSEKHALAQLARRGHQPAVAAMGCSPNLPSLRRRVAVNALIVARQSNRSASRSRSGPPPHTPGVNDAREHPGSRYRSLALRTPSAMTSWPESLHRCSSLSWGGGPPNAGRPRQYREEQPSAVLVFMATRIATGRVDEAAALAGTLQLW
jgi:hypothetical protein